ncbi:uncharacterized protein LOC141602394 [Silene latifolia]|uniref:uncharacterized protein LOC141602394 n=1 Tax=Silene latifolia TaxID=37657 RepID=UPI003D782386
MRQIPTQRLTVEVMPLLLKNADRWVSSRLMVSSNKKEAVLKLLESEQLNTDKYLLPLDEEELDFDISSIEANSLNTVRCTEVMMDLSIIGVIDVKLTEIQSRDDFKALLLHLMSMAGVVDASTSCFSGLVLKEKARVLESYSHATT